MSSTLYAAFLVSNFSATRVRPDDRLAATEW
jgi:hypothetical protein